MKTAKLTESEMAPLRVASLPTRPTAPQSYGGKGYTSVQMKEAFDKLPNLIAERLNSLLDDIVSGDICASIPTGNDALPYLKDLSDGIWNGNVAASLKVFDTTLIECLAKMQSELDNLKLRLESEVAV